MSNLQRRFQLKIYLIKNHLPGLNKSTFDSSWSCDLYRFIVIVIMIMMLSWSFMMMMLLLLLLMMMMMSTIIITSASATVAANSSGRGVSVRVCRPKLHNWQIGSFTASNPTHHNAVLQLGVSAATRWISQGVNWRGGTFETVSVV